eukprot:TRINITY_DN243_c0_g1::TRINITY_DN243_c0_g1_i1::g.1726::m.1726 TRINITY_DN243_c0_g1::TRINITY_DN243_c0_g1_i1::g.1726  ORF type:complete len:144 (+),score=11.62,sp/P0DN08/VKT53_ANEVI/47.22/2e-16,Kunitz_BPTI/PF00014.18/8.4e-19,Kunitz_BPTI/PF00014.18/3.9e+03,Kelch_3/PF13415.1/8.8e+03,Kelch_3/PF13415.1/2.9 TRINITY_DN243_c0_g1_i1:55-432(+)
MKFLLTLALCLLGTTFAIESRCNEPKQIGTCKAMMRKYRYNPDTAECEIFVYGGCGGNGNNFNTLEDCQKACIDETVESQPPSARRLLQEEEGDCRSSGCVEGKECLPVNLACFRYPCPAMYACQ